MYLLRGLNFQKELWTLNIDKVVYNIDEFLGAVVENELNELLY